MIDKSFKKREYKIFNIITKTRLLIVLFIVVFVGLNYQQFKAIQLGSTYYTSQNQTKFPIIYQVRNDKKINILRGFRDEKYREIANDTLTILNYNDRELNLNIYKNGNNIRSIQYEIRNKITNDLLERTVVYVQDVDKENVKVSTVIQNLLDANVTYFMTIKIDIGDVKAYYFSNIMMKKKTILDGALDMAKDFTEKTFDKIQAAELVKYLETNPNVDQKQMYNVNIESSFEQLTWAETNMERITDYYYYVYQVQDFCYNVNLKYLTMCQNENNQKEYYNVKDEYVIRWDGARFYFMKVERSIEEYFNIDNKDIYDKERKRLSLGITNIENFEKIESDTKNFTAFNKNKEIYLYDANRHSIKNVYGSHMRDDKNFMIKDIEADTKLLSVDDFGNVRFMVYGYNSCGANEGLIGISVFTYYRDQEEVAENIFLPLYTTYENLKYDLEKMCLQKNDIVYFKSFDKIYGVDVLNGSTMVLVDNIEDSMSEGSYDDLHFAYNEKGENMQKVITLVNMEDMSREYIKAGIGEKINVITFMNDDLFYGIANERNEWIEDQKVIGYPYKKIIVVNTVTKEQKVFQEENNYYYNFVRKKTALHFNKYTKNGNHYYKGRNDVIINSYINEDTDAMPLKEEMTKRKLRTAYLTMDTKKENIIKEKQIEPRVKDIPSEMLEEEVPKESDIYYVYNNGVLKSKTKVLSDGIDLIRDSFGYVKMNDKITCYNRSNKNNLSYLKQDNTILENLKQFKENICLIDNKILVVNLTGVKSRDLEYYITLGEKVACYYNDEFQFFITGYDNKNYVVEYMDGERVLTSREDVQKWVEDDGYIMFSQVVNLE